MPTGLLIGTDRHAFKKKNREGGEARFPQAAVGPEARHSAPAPSEIKGVTHLLLRAL